MKPVFRLKIHRIGGAFLSAVMVLQLLSAGGAAVYASEHTEDCVGGSVSGNRSVSECRICPEGENVDSLLDETGIRAASGVLRQFTDLDFSDENTSPGNLYTDGYEWNVDSKTLKLKDTAISGTVTLPDDTVTIETEGECSVHQLQIKGDPQKTHLIFSGTSNSTTSNLTIEQRLDISGGNSNALTVNANACVVANGGISIGTSGGTDSVITVKGTLTAEGADDISIISAGRVVVADGGTLGVSGVKGVQLNGMSSQGSRDFKDVFTVESGGCFTANCSEYNVVVYSGTGSFLDGSHADQAISVPEGYLPADCGVKQDTDEVNLIKISTGKVYTGYLTIHENHDWPDGWNGKDEISHWKICIFAGCGKTKDETPHNFDNSTKTCDACGAVLDVALNNAVGLTYNGREHRPDVIVTIDGTTLDRSKYNTVYSDNINAGEATVTVTGNGLVFKQTLKFQIAKATPIITWNDTVQTVTYSGCPAVITPPAVTLANGGDFDGEIHYSYAADSSAGYTPGLPTNAGLYTIKAGIAEQDNYTTADSTDTLTLTINRADYAPNRPSAVRNVAWKYNKVSMVELPTDWQWKETDQDTALEVNAPVTVAAVYIGADKDNYKNVTADVTITRLECTHESTERRNIVAATCLEKGYSGDLFCTDCGIKISSGASVAATGHDWHITSEIKATTISEGTRIYTCSNCGITRKESVPRLPQDSHMHSYSVKETKAATCTENGVMTYSCSCGDSYTENIPMLGHNYESKVTREPTVFVEGEMTYTCSRCGDTYTKPIDRREDTPSKPSGGRKSRKPSAGDDTIRETEESKPEEAENAEDKSVVTVGRITSPVIRSEPTKTDSETKDLQTEQTQKEEETDKTEDENIMTASGNNLSAVPSESEVTDALAEEPQREQSQMPWWIILILILLIILAILVFLATRKKKEEKEEEKEEE